MRLKELLQGIYHGELDPVYGDMEITSISDDSRRVQENSMFVALKGADFDGSHFIQEAVRKGARIIACSRDKMKDVDEDDVCCLEVQDTRQFLRRVVPRFYHYPAQVIKSVGVTGTNGKTTVAHLIEAMMRISNRPTAMIGTIYHKIGDDVFPSKNTTPGFLANQRFLAQAVKRGVQLCIMETSSHALDQGRVDSIDFKYGIFTNLTSEHLDYHASMDHYFEAKAKLFNNLSRDSYAIINVDDPYGLSLSRTTQAKVLGYGIEHKTDIMACDIKSSIDKTEFVLEYPNGRMNMSTPLIGRYNVYNILAAAAFGLSEGMDINCIKEAIEQFVFVPGRLERVEAGQDYSVFIDYAHTADALRNVLSAIKDISDQKIILVFGCGGDRDRTKRPAMSATASELADFVFVTNDNPRGEDPQQIMGDMIKGFEGDHYRVVVDRREAIEDALKLARPCEIVLIAGKGHERYQIFKDKTVDFDERKIIQEYVHATGNH